MNSEELEDDEIVGDLAIAGFLSDRLLLPHETLRDLSGDDSLAKPGSFPSGLIKRVAKAWITPLDQITCAQVRVLVGQQFGLEWLARPTALFLAGHPRAECDLYPGDLTCMALRAANEMLRHAREETRLFLAGDFSWMVETFAFDDEGNLLREAEADLSRARQFAEL